MDEAEFVLSVKLSLVVTGSAGIGNPLTREGIAELVADRLHAGGRKGLEELIDSVQIIEVDSDVGPIAGAAALGEWHASPPGER